MENNGIKLKKISRVVMICTGNICRSPMAWGIGRREAEKRGLDIEIDSAGTGACEGYTPSLNSIISCEEIGIDISSHIAKQVDGRLCTDETLYAVMTRAHADWLHGAENIPRENIVILGAGIPDPYGRELAVYQRTRDAIEEAVIRLFDNIAPLSEKLTDADRTACDRGDDSSAESAEASDSAEAGTASADFADGTESCTGQPVIIPAQTDHIAPIAQLESECFTDPWSEECFRQESGNDASDFAAAVVDGEVCGYAVLYSAGGVSEIPKICVSPKMRRKGIARALLGWLEERACERGSFELTLEVRESNEPARALYAACGFDYIGIRPNFYSNPRENAVIMTKTLSDNLQTAD